MAVLHLNPENFEQTVSNGKVMVDFWAPWCMPCQSLLPTIDALAWKKNVWLELIQKKNIWRSSIIFNPRNQLPPPF